MESFLNRAYGFDQSKIENRKYLRFPLSLEGQCHYTTGGAAQKCRIVDVCDQGLGFELDSPASIQQGQNLLLSIFLPEKKTPFNAIVRLQWSKTLDDGALKQRIGSRLLFMDPKEKAHLLQHAHAMRLVGASKNCLALRAMTLRYPKLNV